MIFTDAIREARTEQEVFHLLNAYVEEVGYRGKPAYLLEGTPALLRCANDVTTRCLGLMGELDRASKQLDDHACLWLKEALHVFSNALNRLKLLEREPQQSLAGYYAVHIMNTAARGLSDAGSGPDAR